MEFVIRALRLIYQREDGNVLFAYLQIMIANCNANCRQYENNEQREAGNLRNS